MTINNDLATKAVLTDMDRSLARMAWDIYMYEINGTGLRWMFNKYPFDEHEFHERGGPVSLSTRRDAEMLERSLNQVHWMTKILEGFVDRPITEPNPLGYLGGDRPSKITRLVTDQEVAAYRNMTNAVQLYLLIRDECGGHSEEAQLAARKVFYTISPRPWRDAGAPIAADAVGVFDNGHRCYLEAVIGTK